MGHAFISYVRENEDDINRLHKRLEAAGISCWLDKKDIKPGEFWPVAIVEAIQSGACFLACFSIESERKPSSHMREEIYMAIEAGKLLPPDQKWIIPIRLSECAIPPYNLGGGRVLTQVQYTDLFTDWEEGVRKLLESLNSIFEKPKAPLSVARDRTLEQQVGILSAIVHDLNNLNMIAIGYLQILELRDIMSSGLDSRTLDFFEGLKEATRISEALLKKALPELRYFNTTEKGETTDSHGSTMNISQATIESKMQYQEPFYWRINKQIKDGPFCPQCWDNDKKEIRLKDHKNGAWTCPTCDNNFIDSSWDINGDPEMDYNPLDYK